MNVAKRVLSVFVFSLLAAGMVWAQPSVGGAKKKANESKDQQQKKENEKAGASKEPVVFTNAPDEKCHFEIDASSKRNVIKFESKAPAETIESKVNKITGTMDFNPRKMDKVEGTFTINWKDVDTGNPTRNTHMMGKDWVDAATYPDVVFTVTGIEGASAKDKPVKAIKCTLVGKMTMHGKDHDMKIPATLTYIDSLPAKKGEAPHDGLSIKTGKFKVALADYDIKGKAGVVGNKVAGEQEFTTVAVNLTGPEHKETKAPTQPKMAPKKPPVKGG